ncbi:MAG: zinc ribbon domain-containing protein [Candidatus Bathyarchaeota archaeon]|nr:MAG: zinc ribbon domain-containing protein [Candidatus Bathyarchaeota archaeon]
MWSRGIDVGEAFSAGLGIALGLVMGQYMLEAMAPPRKIAVKYVLLCRECAAQNPIENKFCGTCGRSLYPPPQITCQKCGSKMPSTVKFCGNCGLALPK